MNNSTRNIHPSVIGQPLQMLSRFVLIIVAASLMVLSPSLSAQSQGTGTVKGRVMNAATQTYLANARVTVAGTHISAITGEDGGFTLLRVPAGDAKINVTYTGMNTINTVVAVSAGGVVIQDLYFNTADAKSTDVVTMDTYTVESKRFQSAQELAIQAERAAVNIKDVVAIDSLGYIPTGNVGEFLKYMPGVQVDYGAVDAFDSAGLGGTNPGVANQVSMRGFGSSETTVLIDGMPVAANAGPGGAVSRAVGIDLLSINDVSRVEMVKVPTPDMAANVLGGVVNLVTKSAYEFAKPTYGVRVGFNYIEGEGNPFKKQPGPGVDSTYHTGIDASVTASIPVNKKLGFSVGVATSNAYYPNYKVEPKYNWGQTARKFGDDVGVPNATFNTNDAKYTATTATQMVTTVNGIYGIWRRAGSTGTNNTTNANTVSGSYPFAIPGYDWTKGTTTSAWTTTTTAASTTTMIGSTTVYFNMYNVANGKLVNITNPFMANIQDSQNPWNVTRYSGNIKVDWRPVPELLLTARYAYSQSEGVNVNYRLQVSHNYAKSWGPDFQEGLPYWEYSGGGQSMTETVTSRDNESVAHNFMFKANYSKGPWTVNFDASFSKDTRKYEDFDNGHVYQVDFSSGSSVGNINMYGIKDGIPAQMDVYDRTGQLFDWKKLNQWSAGDLKIATGAATQTSEKNRINLNFARELDFLPFKAKISAGWTRDIEKDVRTGRGSGGFNFNYVGADKTGVVKSDFIDSIINSNMNRSKGIGIAKHVDWVDTYMMYDVYKANPSWFEVMPTVYSSGTTVKNPAGSFVYDYDLNGNPIMENGVHKKIDTSEKKNMTNTVQNYISLVQGSKDITQTKDSYFVMISGELFSGRLTYVGGVRGSRSELKGIRVFQNGNWNYVQNPDGTRYTDAWYPSGVKINSLTNSKRANGLPTDSVTTTPATQNGYLDDADLVARLKTAGVETPGILRAQTSTFTGTSGFVAATNNNNADTSTLEAQTRYRYLKEIDDTQTNPWQPQLGVAYKILDTLDAKLSWNRAIGLPPLGGTNTAGAAGVLSTIEITENDPNGTSYGDLGKSGTIKISNPGLKAKTTDSFNFELAWRYKYADIKVSPFYTFIRNEWLNYDYLPTDPGFNDMLDLFGMPREVFKNFTITTQDNATGTTKNYGYEISVRQNFGMLGSFMSHFNLWANMGMSKFKRPPIPTNKLAQLPIDKATYKASGMLTFNNSRFLVSLGANWVDESNRKEVLKQTIEGVETTVYSYEPSLIMWRLNVEYRISKIWTVMASCDNLTNEYRSVRYTDTAGLMAPWMVYSSVNEPGRRILFAFDARF